MVKCLYHMWSHETKPCHDCGVNTVVVDDVTKQKLVRVYGFNKTFTILITATGDAETATFQDD